ncbi:DUF6356 family protein [Polycladidibacter hongkongensis]|uniref:DUF6356 family protein n=1 Tax=Polycladidibacter hongkongensis TaxID=1647556 RepID=UPI00083546DC|nr:DUF6356 family protein [Pseudovibrio hongkongensis]
MAGISKAFTEHPQSVGETYLEHAAFAGKTGFVLIGAGLAALMHGLFPFMFERTASEIILKLAGRFKNRGRSEEDAMKLMGEAAE